MCVWALGQNVLKTATFNLRGFFMLNYLYSYLWDQATRDKMFNNAQFFLAPHYHNIWIPDYF